MAPLSTDSPLNNAMPEELRAKVMSALRTIPAPFRFVLLLWMNDYSDGDIARLLRTNRESARNKIIRAKAYFDNPKRRQIVENLL